MKAKRTIAKVLAAIALKSAKAAYGAASCYGAYQPKEPEALKRITKK